MKLTEKEVNTINYLSKSKKPVSIDELQEKVWSYQSDMKYTVETHIYRLRKKFQTPSVTMNLLLAKKMAIKLNKKNPMAKDLFTKKYKPKVVSQKSREVLKEKKIKFKVLPQFVVLLLKTFQYLFQGMFCR